jgi:glycosyltransferase involved in cell wall biosynthesis
MFMDRSTKLEHVRELERKARGGMVTSLFKVSDYLANAGHDVTVFSDIASTGRTKFGTKWLDEYWGEYDVLVTNRGIGCGYSDIRAKRRILWTHDLPHSGFIPEPKNMMAYDRVVFMSRYAENVWRLFFKTIGKSVFIPNGVDKTIFYPRQKHYDRLIFASAPNRGLDKLPLILDSIRSRLNGGYALSAYSSLAKLHPGEGEDKFDYTPIEESDVDLMDPVPQDVFANKLGQASLMIMPTGYPEICSNAVLQSLVSGTPVITTGHLGATPEWIKHRKNGMLTISLPHDYMIHVIEMVRNIVTVLESKKLHDRLIRGALKTKVLTWDEVGAKWEKMLKRICRF